MKQRDWPNGFIGTALEFVRSRCRDKQREVVKRRLRELIVTDPCVGWAEVSPENGIERGVV